MGGDGNISCSAQSTRSAPPSWSSRSCTSATRSGQATPSPQVAQPRRLAADQPLLVRLAGDPDPGRRAAERTPTGGQHPAQPPDRPRPAMAALAAHGAVPGLELGVVVDLAPVRAQGRVRVGVVPDLAAEHPDLTVHHHLLVDHPAVEAGPLGPKEPDVAGVAAGAPVVTE